MELVPGSPAPDFKERLEATYDAHADERDRSGESTWRWPLLEKTIALLKREGKRRLLEIGAGPGHTAKYFDDRGLEVVAVDLSPAHVERCRAKGLTAYHRDFYDLGFRIESFDAVWAVNCLHHVPDRDLPDVLDGIRDVLVRDGVFCLGTWGGIDGEGTFAEDPYEPPRYFALRSDDALLGAVESRFTVEEFSRITPPDHADEERLHIQFLRARKP